MLQNIIVRIVIRSWGNTKVGRNRHNSDIYENTKNCKQTKNKFDDASIVKFMLNKVFPMKI